MVENKLISKTLKRVLSLQSLLYIAITKVGQIYVFIIPFCLQPSEVIDVQYYKEEISL